MTCYATLRSLSPIDDRIDGAIHRVFPLVITVRQELAMELAAFLWNRLALALLTSK